MHFNEEQKKDLYIKLDGFFAKHATDKKSAHDASIFRALYRQFLEENPFIDWKSWKFISEEVQVNYEDLPVFDETRKDVLSRLVVIKLNGGLGTSMGCAGPKAFIPVKGKKSFMDIALLQHQNLNETHECHVPLILMNSFYTEKETLEKGLEDVRFFSQAKCPRIYADNLLPVDECGNDEEWYPPGHGNIFHSLEQSGLLDELINQGRDVIFVSNVDNTGATVDPRIASYFCDHGADYLMECTKKTQNDIKGGTLIDINGQLMHLEMPQVPPEHLDEFCSTRTFKIFNTNNIWVNLRTVKQRLATLKSEIIVNRKKLSSGRDVIQLETSIGGSIRNFPKSYCLHVPRSRFLPVKKCDDLLAIASELFTLSPDGALTRDYSKPLPTVSLGKHFEKVDDFVKRFDSYPEISELHTLVVQGNVRFAKNVTLKGDVRIINNGPTTAEVAENTVLENEEIDF